MIEKTKKDDLPDNVSAQPGHRRACIHTYGCQMNKLDSEIASSALRDAGYEIVDCDEEADVIIFNTCSVRDHAEHRVISNAGALKRLKKERPHVLIGIMGCMAQRLDVELMKRLPHIDLVCGTRMFPHIAELLERAATAPVVATEMVGFNGELRHSSDRTSRHSAFVEIIRGCDNFCSYCIVPYVRGGEESRPPDEIEDEVRRLVDDGCVEITLLGQNVDSYGRTSKPRSTLAELLYRLDPIDGLERLRFVTSHPRFISSELIDAMNELSSPCEYLHMPAQSGSNSILKTMRRGYTRERYLDIIDMARDKSPDIGIASDFIVGFPGESESDFEDTADLMKRARFQNCFVFKYSPRPGTAAAELTDDVPEEEKGRRLQTLLKIQESISAEENARYIGKTVEALVEGPSKSDSSRLSGRMRSNKIVIFPGGAEDAGKTVNVRIERATPLSLYGQIVDSNEKRH